ncbi:MAG: YggS family pyridoxal phosphate-dependent enzyme [Candidatus Methylomirabilaceae bacterium]
MLGNPHRTEQREAGTIVGEEIRARVEQVRRRIAEAAGRAGRRPGDVELVAVSKAVPISRIRDAVDAGVTALGENRVHEAREKVPLLESPAVTWHLVGHLQTNKGKLAVELFDLIHSVDSLKLAHVLDRQGATLGKRVRVLIQVELGGEPTKSGIRDEHVIPLLHACRDLSHLAVEGLMIMPPFREHPEEVRPFFRQLRELRDRAGDAGVGQHLAHLSMGMSHDFEVAIEEGATLVRIGTAIFGERPQD